MSSSSWNPHAANTSRQSRAVVQAGLALADALESKREGGARQRGIAAAVEGLQQAAGVSDAQAPSRQGFSSKQDNPESGSATAAITVGDRIALAADDATMAHVLFAASEAVGERSDAGGPRPLRAALRAADLEQAHDTTTSVQRFAAVAATFSSGDLEHALGTFRLQATSALQTILKETDDAIEKIFTSLAKSKDVLLDAFGQVGQLFQIPAGAAILFRTAWQKLLSALQGLQDLINDEAKTDNTQSLIEVIKAQTVRGGVEHILKSDDLLHDIQSMQAGTSVQWSDVDDLSGKLAAMSGSFESIVANIRRIATVVVLVAPIAVAHLSGPFAPLAPLFVPAAYALAIVAILVVGYDFAHVGRFNTGNGIRELILKIETTAPPPGS